MTVKRIVPNIATDDTVPADRFYGDLLRMQIVMDEGWIVTYAAEKGSPVQISVVNDHAAPVPDMSIEIDDVHRMHHRADAMGFEIVYPLTHEDWGVTRFMVRDPFGRIVNILSHD